MCRAVEQGQEQGGPMATWDIAVTSFRETGDGDGDGDGDAGSQGEVLEPLGEAQGLQDRAASILSLLKFW